MVNYKKLLKNVYRVAKPKTTSATPCTCHRFGERNCGETCMNRRANIECGASCYFQDNCENKRIQQNKCPNILLAPALPKGQGVFAAEDIKKDIFIKEYIGEIINKEQLTERCAKYTELGNEHWYFMSVWSNLFIDATEMGNEARYFNHSCEPNCKVEFWQIAGRNHVGIFASEDIKKGEELTYNYRAQVFGYTFFFSLYSKE